MSFAPWAASQEWLASALLAAAVILLVLHVSMRLANQALSQPEPALHVSGPPVHLRVRVAMYLILVVASAYAGLQAWNALQWQRVQHLESRISDALSLERSAGQELMRQSALLGQRPTDDQARDALAAVLHGEAARSASLQADLASTAWYRDEEAVEVAAQVARWRSERARLYIAVQQVWHLVGMGAPTAVPARVTQVLEAGGRPWRPRRRSMRWCTGPPSIACSARPRSSHCRPSPWCS